MTKVSSLKSFVAESHISEKLIRAVVRKIGGWESFTNYAEDVANHGAMGGFIGFTYYCDTVAFASKLRSEIMDYAEQLAKDLGDDGALSMIAGFNCLRDYKITQSEIADGIYNGRSEHRTTVLNALAWFALEEVCRSYVDLQ